jgi:TonB family protein
MSVLFNDARSNTGTRPPARSSTGLWLSLGAHVALAGFLITVPIRASEKPSTRPRSIGVFRMAARELPTLKLAPVVEAPRRPPVMPPRPAEPVRQIALAEVPKPAAVVPIAAKPMQPAPAVLPPAAPTFERPVETKAPERAPETGLFERANGTRTSQTVTEVMAAGFGSVSAAPRGTATGTVTTGGFGNAASSPRGAANGGGDVQAGGFERRASAPAQPAATAVPTKVDRPVEILSKPTPEYTDEARNARIEGTVTLELEFTAAGDVRVLRVVRGLGHGLDEAAERAALRIRFKPAQSSDGRPVDSRATVHITFRLS